jgi:uncharacterized protein
MKQLKNSYRLLSRLSHGFVPLMITAIFIPFIILAVFGAVSLFEKGQWLLFLGLSAVFCLVIFLPFLFLKQRATKQRRFEQDQFKQSQAQDGSQQNTLTDDDFEKATVEPNAEWSEFDLQVWKKVNTTIQHKLDSDDEWGSLREHGFELASHVAREYAPNATAHDLAFTAPEFLLMVEEVSHRYRHFLKENIPFSEKIKLTTIKQGYAHKDKMDTAKKAYDVYRIFRAVTPAGWIAEARSQIVGRLFDEVSADVQHRLKKTLLQEVVSVAIDLYSGRFKARDTELAGSDVVTKDRARVEPTIEPLRVAVIGQVSAGKSSVVNAVVGSMVAEVSAIPSTDSIHVHKCEVDGVDLIHLVDLPGIDGNAKTEALIVDQIANSDLILWVLKANQSARTLDTQLKAVIDHFYTQPKNRSRKKPQILALVNQVDRLQPVQDWQPPYNIEQPTTAKAKMIKAAVEYNQELLSPDHIIPVCVSEDKAAFNLDEIGVLLQFAYEDGVNTQLNRRRIEGDKTDYLNQAKRLFSLSKVAFKQLRDADKHST